MISIPKVPSTALSQQAYQCHTTGQGQTYTQRQCSMTNCPKCNKAIQQGSLLNHLKQVHKELPNPELQSTQLGPNMTTTITPNRLLYITSIPDNTIPSTCPIPICATLIKSLIIIEEGYLPRCPTYLLHTNNIAHHNLTKRCHLGTVCKEYRQLEHERPAILKINSAFKCYLSMS